MSGYNLYKTITGSEFKAVTMTLTGQNLTGAEIIFKVSRGGRVFMAKRVGDGISVTDATNGVFKVGPFAAAIKPGAYQYSIRIVLAGGQRSYVRGTWIILPEP